MLLAIVVLSGFLVAVLIAALVVVLRGDQPTAEPAGGNPTTPADASAATLLLDPASPMPPGPVTARVIVVSPFAFEAVAIDVDGARVASSTDPGSLLAFPVVASGPHQAVATVRLANGDEIRSAAVPFTTLAAGPP